MTGSRMRLAVGRAWGRQKGCGLLHKSKFTIEWSTVKM
jgi:hypothetical protein